MRHYLSCCPVFSSKPWHMPFCAFFTSFTIVMAILVLSTDLKVGRHYIRFNTSYLWEFEEISQENPALSQLIKEQYIVLPQPANLSSAKTPDPASVKKPSLQIFNIFRKKRFGTFLEAGSDGTGDTEWLESVLGWTGLLTQPRPSKFQSLVQLKRPRTRLAQVCISPTFYPKHAYFKYNDSYNETLSAVPCFPLYSLMRTLDTLNLDLLSLSDVTAPIQVLKTLPIGRLSIKAIAIKNYGPTSSGERTSLEGGGEVEEDLCCTGELASLLDRWGYRGMYRCTGTSGTGGALSSPADTNGFISKCYFLCARSYCPMMTRT